MKRLLGLTMVLLLLPTIRYAHAGSSYIHGVNHAHLTGIFHRGRSQGNQSDVFAKIGDSISMDNGYFLIPVGLQYTVYGSYTPLKKTVDYYSQTSLGDGNSFSHASVATRGGLVSGDLLDIRWIGTDGCATPLLVCEYDQLHPSIAIIMIGSNDAGFGVPVSTYRANLRQIIEISLDRNIIPVLSTLPRWLGKNDLHPRDMKPYNDVVVQLACYYKIPWIDLNAALETLPHYGLSSDGVHPSAPTDWTGTAIWTDEYLSVYGYNVRNLLTVDMLRHLHDLLK